MPDFALEQDLLVNQKNVRVVRWVAGVDEAGRGPLAGPVVAAAVMLPMDWPSHLRLDDSKRLSPAAREMLYKEICKRAIGWRIQAASPAQVDGMGVLNATFWAMSRCLQRLRPRPDWALIDGPQVPLAVCPCKAVVKGDSRSNSIAAASILAKTSRDRVMRVYGARFPLWNFAQHKGYPTRGHRVAIAQHGLSPIHRRSFRALPANGLPQKPTRVPKSKSQLRGRWGEALAADYLSQLGATVVAKNYVCREGEIDIVAQLESFMVFAEVKNRASDQVAYHPSLAVNRRKQCHLRLAAERYLLEHDVEHLQPRFDVICICGKKDNPRLEHIPNAF